MQRGILFVAKPTSCAVHNAGTTSRIRWIGDFVGRGHVSPTPAPCRTDQVGPQTSRGLTFAPGNGPRTILERAGQWPKAVEQIAVSVSYRRGHNRWWRLCHTSRTGHASRVEARVPLHQQHVVRYECVQQILGPVAPHPDH